MDIKKSSWHYRFMDGFYNHVPTSLCPYFWKFVWATLVSVAAATALIGAFSAIGLSVLKKFGFEDVLWTYIAGPFLGLVIIVTGVAILFGFFWTIDTIKDRRRQKRHEDRINGVVHQDGLVLAFMKAKKRKICPTLHFIE